MRTDERVSKAQIADYLDQVADWFEDSEHGWMQRAFTTVNLKTACAIGAMRIVAGSETLDQVCGNTVQPDTFRAREFNDGREEFRRCLKANDKGDSIFNWNDRYWTTKEEVIAEFRACAARLREQAQEEADA